MRLFHLQRITAVVNRVVADAYCGCALLAWQYNLTNINIEERIREIASLKVLSYAAQVDAMSLRERPY